MDHDKTSDDGQLGDAVGGEGVVVWGADGAPRSALFDDVYFDRRDGRGEREYVFLGGCGLPEAWAGRDHYTIGELGFGLGLGFLCVWAIWASTPPPRPALRYVSFEIAPPCAADIRRAAAAWPDLSVYAERLLTAKATGGGADGAGHVAAEHAEAEHARESADWPPPRGWSRRRLADPPAGLTLDLAVGDAAHLAPQWRGCADAWFLDGFAPAKNPGLWSPELLRALASRTAPDGRFATYAAAGWVRRALAAAGWVPRRRPGFGRKREMTVGRRAAPEAPIASSGDDQRL